MYVASTSFWQLLDLHLTLLLQVSGSDWVTFRSSPLCLLGTVQGEKNLLHIIVTTTKGQIKPKAHWRAVDSPKKRTNEFVLFAFLLFTANKTNLFVRFLGESTVRPNCFRFYWPLHTYIFTILSFTDSLLLELKIFIRKLRSGRTK